MKAFIDRVFKMKKQKQLDKEAALVSEEPILVEEQATEAMVESIIQEVKKEVEEVKYPKPNHFPDCTCFKCYKWKSQNA